MASAYETPRSAPRLAVAILILRHAEEEEHATAVCFHFFIMTRVTGAAERRLRCTKTP